MTLGLRPAASSLTAALPTSSYIALWEVSSCLRAKAFPDECLLPAIRMEKWHSLKSTGEAQETASREGDQLTPKAQAGHLPVGTEDTSQCLVTVLGDPLITGPLSTRSL